jgi:outer membrane protein OmpA-like peptidoglycan-associated protein
MAFAALGQTDPSRTDSSRTPPPPFLYLGGYFSYGPGLDFASLRIIPFELCDSLFSSGSGTTMSVGGLVEFPTSWPFAIQLRPGVAWSSGELRERIQGGDVRIGNGSVVPLISDQVLDYKRFDLSLSALLVSSLLSERLKIGFGLQLSHTLRSDQTRRQVAVSPDDFLFNPNRAREFVLLSGELLDPSPLVVGVNVGASYEVPISRQSTIAPELRVTLPLNSYVSDGRWTSLSLHAGIAVRFGLSRALPPPDTPRPDTPPPVAVIPQLNPHIETRPPEVIVQVDEYDSTEVLPLLTQVFFAEGSSRLRDVYQQLTPSGIDTFSTSRLFGSALDVYYQMLNIIGRRMRELPEASLTINGYRNTRESDPQLARNRAMAIRDYLVNVWRIPASRLKVSGGKLPPSPTRENSEEGYEENGRVELVASDPNVTRPVVRRHIQRTATPPAITFLPRLDTATLAGQWRLQVNAQETEEGDETLWKQFTGRGMPPDSIVWDWRNDRGRLPELPLSLGYMLLATPGGPDLWQSSDTHRIMVRYDSVQHRLEQRRNDTSIKIYSLLLFDYDSPRVSASDKVLLSAIGADIADRAVVRVTGYTDSLGEASHNRELANQRAEETAKILRTLVPRSVTVVASKEGGEQERFPYSTPEGRSHCRTVVIEVRTPLSSDGS